MEEKKNNVQSLSDEEIGAVAGGFANEIEIEFEEPVIQMPNFDEPQHYCPRCNKATPTQVVDSKRPSPAQIYFCKSCRSLHDGSRILRRF